MSLKKGDRLNPNGRPKGSKNKANADLRTWVKTLLENNTELFEKDLAKIRPSERLNVLQGLLKFSIPTLASTTIEAQIQSEYIELQKLLENAPNEAIEKISDRIINLKNQTENEQK